MSGTELSDVRVALARIDERQEASAHRLKNIDMKIDACATTRDLEALVSRIKEVETTQKWITRSATIGFSAVMGGLYALGKKLGVLS